MQRKRKITHYSLPNQKRKWPVVAVKLRLATSRMDIYAKLDDFECTVEMCSEIIVHFFFSPFLSFCSCVPTTVPFSLKITLWRCIPFTREQVQACLEGPAVQGRSQAPLQHGVKTKHIATGLCTSCFLLMAEKVGEVRTTLMSHSETPAWNFCVQKFRYSHNNKNNRYDLHF